LIADFFAGLNAADDEAENIFGLGRIKSETLNRLILHPRGAGG